MNALHTRTQADGKEEKTRGQVARVNTNIFDAPLIIINIAPRREKERKKNGEVNGRRRLITRN